VEETIIKAVDFLRGTPDRSGVLVINSKRDPEYLLRFLPDSMRARLAKFVVVDAVGLAEQRGSSPWMFVRNLSELAFDRMSTEGAEERLPMGMGIAAPLIGARAPPPAAPPGAAAAGGAPARAARLRAAAQSALAPFAAAGPPAGQAPAGQAPPGQAPAGDPGAAQAPAATHVVAR